MIDTGKISVDEAFQLLAVLDATHGPHDTEQTHFDSPAWAGKRLRLRVTNLHTGTTQARASLPLRLLEVGFLIGCHYAPELKGVKIQHIWDSLAAGQEGKLIEVIDQSKGVKVELLVE